MRGEDASYSLLKKPIISINGSVVLDGQNKDVWEWVQENYYTEHPVTLNYEFTQRKNPAVVSYNVYCDIQGKNTNKWLLMSGGHYDGWYGQMTCDDAVGVGQMIGILKYLNDNEITPRYNTRFIFHSGEENVDRGSISHVYNMSNREVLSKAKYIINLDQLGHNHPASFRINTTRPRLFDKNLQKIVEEITTISGYDEKYESKGYKVSIGGLLSNGTTDCVPYTTTKDGNNIPFKQVDLQYINFCKDSFPMYHQTGADHTVGDTLNIVDREDINATVDIIWNVSKYFIVDPDCHFDSITYQKTDSPNDENNDYDAVRITYAIDTIMPSDYVKVRAILTSQDHPVLSRYSKDATHVVTNTITSYQTLTVSLPKTAPAGYYDLSVYLYNSTGEIDNILDNSYDQGIYADDSYYVNNILLSPPNDAPIKPTTPNGPTDIDPWLLHFYSTSTTDPNDDRVRYQWQWTEGNNDNWQLISWLSGATAWGAHSWLGETGNIQIRVRARDIWSHPDFCSPWSDPFTVGISEGCWFFAPTESLCGEPVQFTGYTAGGAEPYTWEWKFSSSLGYEENSSTTNHTYNIPDSNTVSLKVTDDERTVKYYNTTIEIKDVLSNYVTNQTSIKSNSVISFNDTSVVYRDYYIKNWTWDFKDGNISYNRNVTHTYQNDGEYNVTLTVVDNEDHSDVSNQIIHVDSTPPIILAVRNTKNTVAQGFDMTINAEFFDNQSDIDSVKVNIMYPDNTTGNYSMNYTEIGIYSFIYKFNNTEQTGQYNYTIWVTDHAGNMNNTTGFSFTVVPQPFVSFDTPPTPPNQIICNQNWVLVNTTVQDTKNTSAFIDWGQSLKGYWPMESYNDTGVYDNSTYENFGTFQNGMNTRNIVTGKYGKGLEFDGSDDYLDVGTNSGLDLGTSDFTFMVWEKSHNTLYPKKAMILTNIPASESWKGYGFGVMNRSYLIVSQSSGNNVTLQGTIDVTDNTWHHIAYIRHLGACYIYVDGVLDVNSGGMTGKNITNAQHTTIAYDGHMSSWCYFDGLLDEPQLFNRALSREEINASYNNGVYRLYRNFTSLSDGTYTYYAYAIDTTGNQSNTETRCITIDALPPMITDVNASPHTVGFGYNVTITADVVDNGSSVDLVTVQITPPGGVGNSSNHSMTLISNDTYQYVFTDTWLTGQYNYTIWAIDDTNNTASSSGHHFHVSAEATISIATLKNSYSGTQYINITDPPNPPENFTLVGRGLTWNTYYNASSGENILETYQGPVNYQEKNGTWTPINNSFYQLASNHPAYVYGYRNGNDHGLYGVYFKSNAQLDWPVAFAYNKSDDPSIHAVRSKLVGVGYVDPQSNWAYQYLQNVQSSQGQTNDYSITYPCVFTGTDVTWSYGNTGLKEEITMSNATKTVLQNHPPSQYGLNDTSSYLVFITKLDYQNLNLYNGSGVLDGNVTISDNGVEFKDALGQFKCALPLGDAYELKNELFNQKLTYRIVHLNGNTFLLSGLKLSDLIAMTFPVVIDPTLTVYTPTSDGFISKTSGSYNTAWTASSGTISDSASYISIGQKKDPAAPPSFTYTIYRGFVFFNTSALPSNAYLDNATLSLYKKDDYSTTDFDITIQNGQPTYPHNPMQSGDYYRNYYSGNGGSLNTGSFTSGYNAIRLNNLNWINKTGVTKLCLRSSRDISGTAPTGNEYINVHSYEFTGIGCQPKLVINYRNQSKIKNTGSTDIKGYLLIQVQFYNTSQAKWVLDNDTVNESTPQTINIGKQLGLDTIFNGKIRALNLQHGTGTYRVYAAFRDPEGNILKTNNGVELKTWWQFNKT
ncbi:MAG TPA: LamG-like jellyroll fold domain-containing protein [Candidatus Thermoplasmatota archaeon]|nr:LamG-like jellyroll fold domain-containing protein [Candidatus Thermoplasmatota archaeon]